jgi:hypothetical protein
MLEDISVLRGPLLLLRWGPLFLGEIEPGVDVLERQVQGSCAHVQPLQVSFSSIASLYFLLAMLDAILISKLTDLSFPRRVRALVTSPSLSQHPLFKCILFRSFRFRVKSLL